MVFGRIYTSKAVKGLKRNYFPNNRKKGLLLELLTYWFKRKRKSDTVISPWNGWL